MTFYSGQTEVLRKQLQKVLSEKDFSAYRTWVESVAAELNVDFLDCAAALAYLCQSGPLKKPFRPEKAKAEIIKIPTPEAEIRMVRYRLEIGKKHRVSVDDIKNMLVDETGVERKLIGYIDIHNYYSLVKLPEGMPSDIFTHLRSVEINKQALNIKRIRGSRNPRSGKRKSFQAANKQQSAGSEQDSSNSSLKRD